MKVVAFAVLWLFIGVTSAIDCALSMRLRPEDEWNPLCAALLAVGSEWFVLAKFCMAVVILGVLASLRTLPRFGNKALGIACGMAVFQAGLMAWCVWVFS